MRVMGVDMEPGMNIAFFGSSLVSAYWNGAATYYRGIVRALAGLGHRVTFYEPDAYDRQQHRDIADPPWARVVVYDPGPDGLARAVESARGSDLVVKASGVGVNDAWLEAAVLGLQSARTIVAFWDVDAPATLDRVDRDAHDPFGALIGRYDLIFTYGGGPPVVTAYQRLGARYCVPIYNALDPTTHHPVPPDDRFAGRLGFLGNRLPDRERRVESFFLEPAARLPGHQFVLGGSGWDGKPLPGNVRHVGHVYTRDHNAFNTTPRAVLNISRDSMAAYGFSPATRVFEAAGAGACIITDAWEGIDHFLDPGAEILVVASGDEVAAMVTGLTAERAQAIGTAGRARVLAHHTYDHRARNVEAALGESARVARSRVTTARFQAPSSALPAHRPLSIVVLGLSITSSWGNGHATTYRGLVRELAARGHDVLFLERDVPWYARTRDPGPVAPGARVELYASPDELTARFADRVRAADLVIVGSYVPDGAAIADWVLSLATGVTAFYDIDTPVTLAKLAAGDHAYLTPALIPRFDLYLSFTGGPTLDLLERELGAQRARALYCSVDPALYQPQQGPLRWDLSYMGTYSDDRQPALRGLLIDSARATPDHHFAVAGAQYPETIEWPGNVERIEHLAPHDHAAFYGASRFTLNLTRRDMIAAGHSPSVRLFEAAACAVPIISDRWPGLDELFEPGREILLATSCDDVLRHLRDVSDGERAAIAERARARVLAAHTAAHRALELESYLLEIDGH
jgi:spore maturation protein CgeB